MEKMNIFTKFIFLSYKFIESFYLLRSSLIPFKTSLLFSILNTWNSLIFLDFLAVFVIWNQIFPFIIYIKTKINFCVLILYLTTLLSYLNNSNNESVGYLEFSIRFFLLLSNEESFISSLFILISLLFFLPCWAG